MAKEWNIAKEDNWFVGEDKSFTWYITQGKPIVVTASAEEGDTTLKVEPLKEAISDNDTFRWGEMIVTADGAAQVGDVSISIDALTGAIPRGAILEAIVDVTSWTFEWIMKDSPGSSTSILSPSVSITTASEGKIGWSVADTDTDALEPKDYYHILRRTNTGNETVLAYGKATLRRAA